MESRLLTIRLIRLAMAVSLVLPCLLFALASWTSYRNIHALADERLARSLDVQQEEATKTFELIDLTMINASDLVTGMSDADIRQNEERLHLQFKKYSDAVTVVQSIWIYGADGRTLVTSRVRPPPVQSFADRDFFKVHVAADSGTYYGQVYNSSFNGEPFFTVSKRLTRVAMSFWAYLKYPCFRAVSFSSSRPSLTRKGYNMPSSGRMGFSLHAILLFRRERPIGSVPRPVLSGPSAVLPRVASTLRHLP